MRKMLSKALLLSASAVLMSLMTSCGSTEGNSSLFPSTVMKEARQALETKSQALGFTESPLAPYDSVDLSKNEKNALEFLFAYMPTPDIVDHTPEYHLNNVRISLQAREELPWGKDVPAELFRHFVLPLRVNNETLDDFRTEYYTELRDLVKGMNMHDAVLELNHWSHQHITYEPSDGRTSSPLATLRNALGRCGEQSTFVVAVLRTVGIPARQVYTPRWAHTDDNHAWVEAWVDGEWHYIGASEPAPVLDNAWFDAPVMRAMLLQTNAFGAYNGPEEKLLESPTYTILNITSNYVPTAVAKAKVLNADGTPAVGATVTFRLYNYAELYPLTTRTTDENGEASVETGLGDLVVIASQGEDELAMGQISVKEGGTSIEMTLSSYDQFPADIHLTLTPPVAKTPEQKFTPEQEAANNKRMEENNKIRMDYVASFPDEAKAKELAEGLNLTPSNKEKLIELYPVSRGYYKQIADFLIAANTMGKDNEAVQLLASLTDKDLHDINIDALIQVLNRDLSPEEWANPNIISPRVLLEHIYPNQPELDAALNEIKGKVAEFDNIPAGAQAQVIADEISSFKVDSLYNPFNIPVNPTSTWKMKVGDKRSLIILCVRLLRTARIPAKFDEGNNVIVFTNEEGKEQILPFLAQGGQGGETDIEATCPLMLTYEAEQFLKTPRYSQQFSAYYVKPNGQFETYGFDWGVPYTEVNGKQLLYKKNFIATGARQADGTVLYHLMKMNCGEPTALTFDHNDNAISVIGNLDAESKYSDIATGTDKSILSTTGRGYYILVIGKPHHEPTDHVLRDLGALIEGGQAPRPILVLTSNGTEPTAELMALLPQATWGRDTQGIEGKIATGLEHTGAFDLPVIIVADTFNRIVYFNQGYTIGIGDRLKTVLAGVN